MPLLALCSLWTLGLAMAFVRVITATTRFLDTPVPFVLIWPSVFPASIIWVLQELDALDRKRRELEGLRDVYRRRFPVLELLSMYDCPGLAPRVFWEGYKKLPDVQMHEATNRRFRERAAPYDGGLGDSFQRKALIISGVAVLVAALTVVEASIEGGSVEWFVQGLSE